jgi:hypothetical protein
MPESHWTQASKSGAIPLLDGRYKPHPAVSSTATPSGAQLATARAQPPPTPPPDHGHGRNPATPPRRPAPIVNAHANMRGDRGKTLAATDRDQNGVRRRGGWVRGKNPKAGCQFMLIGVIGLAAAMRHARSRGNRP